MIKSITQLGKDYGIKDPYKNYGKLVAKCLEAAKKVPGYSWSIWIKPEEITILSKYIPILKASEKELKGLDFEVESTLGKSPNEIRECKDLLVETTAQFLDQYARGETVLRDVEYQGIWFAWES